MASILSGLCAVVDPRQTDPEAGAAPHLALDIQPPSVLVHHAIYGRQSESGAHSSQFLDSEEWLENMVEVVIGHPYSGVLDRKPDIESWILAYKAGVFIRKIEVLGRDLDGSTIRHRFPGVDDYVVEHAPKLIGVGSDTSQVLCQI